MSTDEFAPLMAINIMLAISQVYAGVTVESAARQHSCTVADLTAALTLPEARLIEPMSDWDAIDLLDSELGEQWRIGTALLEVRSVRTPCNDFKC